MLQLHTIIPTSDAADHETSCPAEILSSPTTATTHAHATMRKLPRPLTLSPPPLPLMLFIPPLTSPPFPLCFRPQTKPRPAIIEVCFPFHDIEQYFYAVAHAFAYSSSISVRRRNPAPLPGEFVHSHEKLTISSLLLTSLPARHVYSTTVNDGSPTSLVNASIPCLLFETLI